MHGHPAVIAATDDAAMDKKDLEKLPKKTLLPGFESGRYEPVRHLDRAEFRKPPFEDPVRRDNRVSIRVSAQDMGELHRLALTEGLPLQSLIANIVHQHVMAMQSSPGCVNEPSLAPYFRDAVEAQARPQPKDDKPELS